MNLLADFLALCALRPCRTTDVCWFFYDRLENSSTRRWLPGTKPRQSVDWRAHVQNACCHKHVSNNLFHHCSVLKSPCVLDFQSVYNGMVSSFAMLHVGNLFALVDTARAATKSQSL
jgi:hypothetical protein